jgi:hypothetical protein
MEEKKRRFLIEKRERITTDTRFSLSLSLILFRKRHVLLSTMKDEG